LVAGQVRVQPISLYADEKIIHLTLLDPKTRRGSGKRAKKARGAKAAARGVKPETERDEDLGADREEAAALPIAVTTPLGRILVTVQAELEAFVEGGLAAQRNVDLLRTAQKRLDALGLTAGARPLDSLLQALATAVRGGEAPAWNDAAGRLLRAYYVTHLAADYETISVACRGLS
jgi:hypothetical protein